MVFLRYSNRYNLVKLLFNGDQRERHESRPTGWSMQMNQTEGI